MRWHVFLMQLCAVLLAFPAEAHPDSLRMKLLAALARGDTAGAIALWQAESGAQTVPKSLQSFQAAFNTVK